MKSCDLIKPKRAFTASYYDHFVVEDEFVISHSSSTHDIRIVEDDICIYVDTKRDGTVSHSSSNLGIVFIHPAHGTRIVFTHDIKSLFEVVCETT